MSHIIEYVGKEGVKTTPLRSRTFQKPKPGDPVLWSEDDALEYYACEAGQIGRIESVGDQWGLTNVAHICCRGGSVFLGDGYVSISGGPFRLVDADRLYWHFDPGLQVVPFWNWGDNIMGANQGVTYHLQRPVWRVKPA